MAKKNQKKRIRHWLAFSAAICLTLLGIAARGPDFTVRFERTVPESAEHLKAAHKWIENPQRWPDWFHSGSQITWSTPDAARKLTPGATARLTVDPKKMRWKRYEIFLTLLSVERTPQQLTLQIRLDGDSKGKVQKVFKDIIWTVALRADGLYGHATAHTQSWRSRLTARLSPRSVMNQIFYPHLFKLARLADGTADTLIEGKPSLY